MGTVARVSSEIASRVIRAGPISSATRQIVLANRRFSKNRSVANAVMALAENILRHGYRVIWPTIRLSIQRTSMSIVAKRSARNVICTVKVAHCELIGRRTTFNPDNASKKIGWFWSNPTAVGSRVPVVRPVRLSTWSAAFVSGRAKDGWDAFPVTTPIRFPPRRRSTSPIGRNA